MTAKKPATVLAYKGLDANFKCRGFQYEVGKTYTHDGKVEHCESGFHACENPLDVWGYYGPFDSRFALVELSGDLSREEGGDSKIAAGSIKIKAELKLPEFISAAVKAVIEACKGSGDDPSGDSAQIGSSGDSARIKAEGKDAVIACAGSVEYFEVGPGAFVEVSP